MSAAVRLEAAILDATEALLEVLGIPEGDNDGPRVPVSGSLVNRHEVPDMAYRAACRALDFLLIGGELLDPECPSCVSVEDGLAAMTRGTEG